MAITALNTTTLTNALNASDADFAVGSTTNISAGSILVLDAEQMLVQAIPVSGRVQVQRGWNGTKSASHVAAVTIHIGSGSTLGRPDENGKTAMTGGSPGTLPEYALPLGARKRDAQGNEYILCNFDSSLYGRQPVTISEAFVAAALSTSGRGRVGVVAEAGGGTSDQWGWVQVYGACLMQIGMSGVSPSDAANGPTTLSTSAQTRFVLATSLSTPAAIGWTSVTSTEQYRVVGISVASDASPGDVSAVTSAASHTGSQIKVFLNFPFIEYHRADT